MTHAEQDTANSFWPDYDIDMALLQTGDCDAMLTPTAVEAFARLAHAWRLTHADAAAILGVSLKRLQALWERRTGDPLDQEEILRIVALVDIQNLLMAILGSDDAVIWPSLPNLQAPFLGRSPIETLKAGDFGTFIDARQCVQIMWLGYNAERVCAGNN